MELLKIEDIFAIHEKVINQNELQGLAGNKSLDAVAARIENHVYYGLIQDQYNLAATYAVVIAVGHVFNDANKRTAFIAMDTSLRRNGVVLYFDTEAIGQMIVKVAQGLINSTQPAHYLRSL